MRIITKRDVERSVGNLEEIIEDNHAINILFIDKDQLERGCSVLLNHKVHTVVGVLSDNINPKAP